MRLALSSAAAPGASLGELLDAAARRGLAAVELVEGHGHALDPALTDSSAATDAARRAAEAGVSIAGYRLAHGAPGDTGPDFRAMVRFARALGAPILLPLPGGARLAAALREEGVEALVVLTAGLPASGGLAALDRIPPQVHLAWEADPSRDDIGRDGSALIAREGARLRHIVLRGGGPEATEQEGRGVGSLMARLAVAGYGGTVALAPSSERYRVIWDAWLGRRGGWGCGSRSEDRSLVTLGSGRDG